MNSLCGIAEEDFFGYVYTANFTSPWIEILENIVVNFFEVEKIKFTFNRFFQEIYNSCCCQHSFKL